MVALNLLQNLPTSALAAVVIAAAIGLIEVTDLRRIYRIQRWEFWLSIVCTIALPRWARFPVSVWPSHCRHQFLWMAGARICVLGRAGHQGLP